ncbi:MAG: hypothetical protein CMG64_04135 [Candidatus Marinimicrobia bacterium]|nr:hypothetical protein [Candidatus Neomarinimicrobiota bacterium]|tara:strand:- start:4332 stop:4928 length:597 start_codon:yes stop_codon:yes gene_type:complete
MYSFFLKYFFIFFITYIYSSNLQLIEESNEWIELQNKEIKIFWIEQNESYFCKSSMIYNFPINKIKKILDNKLKYSKVFKRIEFCNVIKEDVVHMAIDLPFPFYSRDYIVEYQYYKHNEYEYYIYNAVNNLNVPKYKNYIRLINASGLWKLDKIDSSNTKVTYLWNGELLGDFPSWALSKAWISQGNEVLIDLRNELK